MIFKINGHYYKCIVDPQFAFSGTTLEGWMLTAQDNDNGIVESLLKAKFIKEIR